MSRLLAVAAVLGRFIGAVLIGYFGILALAIILRRGFPDGPQMSGTVYRIAVLMTVVVAARYAGRGRATGVERAAGTVATGLVAVVAAMVTYFVASFAAIILVVFLVGFVPFLSGLTDTAFVPPIVAKAIAIYLLCCICTGGLVGLALWIWLGGRSPSGKAPSSPP